MRFPTRTAEPAFLFLAMIATQYPTPEPDESPERFCIRAHRQLQGQIPDPEQRNETIWQLWRKHRGPTTEEELAARTFPTDRYVANPNVCHFAEHSAIDGQGNPRQYDLGEMVRIVRSNNHRIRDFSGFAPISDGHTPDPEDGPADDPDILGYAGPYRLGMIGRENPRWAIFGDEHHIRECAERLRKRPRRSVELWTFANDPTRTHFDPIAAIGAETPRLPLPVKFSRSNRDGALVERYTFSAPSTSFALPGGSNTHLTKFERETPSMLSNEDLSQLIAALNETPQFQWISQQMEAEKSSQPGDDTEGGDEPTQYQEGEEPTPPMPEPDNAPADDLDDLADLIIPEDEEPVQNMGKQHYNRRNGSDMAVKYSRLQKAHNQLVQEHGRMASQMRQVLRQSSDAERQAAVMELASRYPNFVDVEDELERTLYSRAANMSDEEFQNHLGTVEKYAQRAEVSAQMGRPELPRGAVDRGRLDAKSEQYQASLASEAVKIHTAAVNAGKTGYTYEQAKAEAEKRLASAV